MSSEDSSDVTLALVDPSLLSSWEGMVKRGEECSLLLKHSKGKITATLQCTTSTTLSLLFNTFTLFFSKEEEEVKREQGEETEGSA